MQRDYPTQLITDYFKAKAAAYMSPMAIKAAQGSPGQNLVLADVRLPSPELTWRIPGSLWIPAPSMAERFGELSKDKLVVVYCWDTWCGLATIAALALLENGYRVKELHGGVAAWQARRLPQEQVALEDSTRPNCSC